MKRLLILTGDGSEGYESVVASPSHRRLQMVMHDFEPGWDTYVERPGDGVNADATIAEVTCYEHVRSEVARAGGEWQSEQAVRDGRMVTAQTWESHPEVYREVMACLAS